MKNIENDLLNKGYIVKNVSKKNLNDLKKLNYYLFDCAKSLLPKKKITEKNPQVFFNNFAKYISLHNLNDYRVKLMQMINSNSLKVRDWKEKNQMDTIRLVRSRGLVE